MPRWSTRTGWSIPAAWALAYFTGCGTAPAVRPPVATVAHAQGTLEYRVDAEATQLWLYVGADGPLARLGHHHVIISHGLRGTIWWHSQLERSGCELQITVDEFVVDDPKERAAAGPEFSKPIDDDARLGTREHMLGERQLDAVRTPYVSLRCHHISSTPGGLILRLKVTLRGHESEMLVPLTLERTEKTLQASGAFSFKQTDFGLEPYSALLGALRVQDEIRARVHLVARQP